MEMLWLYVGNVSKNAQYAVKSNGTLIHMCTTPSLWLVHIPVVEVGKVEDNEDISFYRLPDNCVVYVYNCHSDEKTELDRAKDTIGLNQTVPEEITPLDDGDVIIDDGNKVTIYRESTTDWYREEERLTRLEIEEEILREEVESRLQNIGISDGNR